MLDRLLGDYLVKEQLLTSGQLNEAYKIQDSHRAKLGVIAVNEKLMSIAQAERLICCRLLWICALVISLLTRDI